MPYTIELSPDMETRLQKRAARRGMTPDDYLQARTLNWLNPRHTNPTPPDILTPDERKILDDLNAELPREFWVRYYALQAKASEGTLTHGENKQLEAMLDKSGDWNIRRIETIIPMASRRGMGWTELMRRLGITHHPVADQVAQEYRK